MSLEKHVHIGGDTNEFQLFNTWFEYILKHKTTSENFYDGNVQAVINLWRNKTK